MTMVSLHVAALPELSVAVHTMTWPLLELSAEIVTEPSALTVQPVHPGGQTQAAATGPWQTSVALAETLSASPLQEDEGDDSAQVIAGGVVSTTVNEQVAVDDRPVSAEVAV